MTYNVLARIEDEGIKPLLDILNSISGFPVLVGAKWDENTFDWINTIFKIREQNFILSFPVISTITIDFKNTTKTTIKVSKHLNYLCVKIIIFLSTK